VKSGNGATGIGAELESESALPPIAWIGANATVRTVLHARGRPRDRRRDACSKAGVGALRKGCIEIRKQAPSQPFRIQFFDMNSSPRLTPAFLLISQIMIFQKIDIGTEKYFNGWQGLA
jgi:hypothetical protein